MRIRKTAAAGAVVLALAATATACGGDSGAAGDKPAGGDVFSGKYKVASAPKIDSPVLKKAQKAKKIVIGVKADQPFLGFKDTTGKYSGFDIEIAKMVAADLGFSEKQIEFKTIDSNVRETTISNGQVDYYVGTYTINDERKKQVGFAGPYYTAARTSRCARTRRTSPDRTPSRARRSARSSAPPRSRRSRRRSTAPTPASSPSTRTV